MFGFQAGRGAMRCMAPVLSGVLALLMLPLAMVAQTDVISREVSVNVSPPGPLDVVSREVSVNVSPPGPLDVVSREVSVHVDLPDLIVTQPVISGSIVAGNYLEVSFSVSTLPGAAFAPWTDSIFLSTDLVAGNVDDVLLANIPHGTGLAPGGSYSSLVSVWIPITVAGSYHLYVETDATDVVEESGPATNNVAFASTPIAVQAFSGAVLSGSEHISPTDTSYDGLDLIVEGTTATIDGQHDFASLIVHQGAVITHTPSLKGGMKLTVAGDVLVTSDSSIDVTGKGYPADTGPGVGTRKWVSIATGSSKHGGGHGGYGASHSSDESTYAPSYGSLFGPRTLGSGGLSASSAGGGAVALHVSGTLDLQGGVRAEGTPQVPSSGGGAGGSIWITASVLAGGGDITADGGYGTTAFPFNSGGGGGGRVHLVTADSSAFTGDVHAFGGYGDRHGGAGTVVLEDTTLGTRELVVRNFQTGLSIASDPLRWGPTALPSVVTFDTVVLDDGARLKVERSSYGLRLRVNGDMYLGSGAAIWGASLGFPSHEGPGAFLGNVGGAGHGGFGGGNGAYGPAYGDQVVPMLPGSGTTTIYATAIGGGAVVVDVAGDLLFDGLINVDANPAGGGSGGSVLLIADTIAGVGSISSRGGNGGGTICGNLYASGAGGRAAMHARAVQGMVGYGGVVNVSGGYHPTSGCGGQVGQNGTVHQASSSTVAVSALGLISGQEDFDGLVSTTSQPTPSFAPGRVPGGFSGSWGNAGAWGFPPTYDTFAAGEDFRIVDTTSFDPGKSGNSLALRETPSTLFPKLFVAGLWENEAYVHTGHAVSVEASVWVASGVGGGGIFSVANGNGQVPTSSLAPIGDMGPAIEWLHTGRLVAHLAGMTSTQEVVLSTPFDAWQRVRMDIDLGADAYDLWWAPVGQPLQLVAMGLPFVTSQKRLDRFVIGQQQFARAFYDDLVVEFDSCAGACASREFFGAGCDGLALYTNAPIIGGSWDLITTGLSATSQVAVTVFGSFRVDPGTSLLSIGINSPGCSVFIGGLLGAYNAPNIAGTATLSIVIPSTPSLYGVRLVAQSMGLTPVLPSMIATSNGVRGIFGN